MYNRMKIKDAFLVNPPERLQKGDAAKKISMECIDAHRKKIVRYFEEPFNGGTKFRNGDTLFARITPCLENGKTSLVDILSYDEIGFGSTEFIVFRGIEDITTNEFVYYVTISDEFRENAISSMTGTTGRQRVQINLLKEKTVFVPSIRIQNKIVSILKPLDDKIETNINNMTYLEEIINAIYNDWFNNFNCPGVVFKHKEEIPFNWENSNAYDNVIEVSERNTDNLDYPVLSVVKEGKFKLSEDVFTKQVYSKNTTNYKIVRRNQVAYNPARANIGSIAMLTDFDAGLVSPIYVVFEMKETITPTFFYYYMKQPMFLENIKHHAIGTTRQNFPFEAFKFFDIIVPPMELQLRFEEIAKPIEQKIAKLKEENAVLAEIRDTLLPKLISGELPVEVGEA